MMMPMMMSPSPRRQPPRMSRRAAEKWKNAMVVGAITLVTGALSSALTNYISFRNMQVEMRYMWREIDRVVARQDSFEEALRGRGIVVPPSRYDTTR